MKVLGFAIIALGVVTAAVGLSALSGLILEVLWNFVVPTVFNGPSIDFPHAWAISALLGIVSGVASR